MKTFKEFLYILSKSDAILAISVVMVISQILFVMTGSGLGVVTLIFWSIWLITISIFRYLGRKDKK